MICFSTVDEVSVLRQRFAFTSSLLGLRFIILLCQFYSFNLVVCTEFLLHSRIAKLRTKGSAAENPRYEGRKKEETVKGMRLAVGIGDALNWRGEDLGEGFAAFYKVPSGGGGSAARQKPGGIESTLEGNAA